MNERTSTRIAAVLIIAASQAGCLATEEEQAAAGVNIHPGNSEVYVKRLVPTGPTGSAGSVRVLQDSLGYLIDSEAIVVDPGRGSVTASVRSDDASFALYAYFVTPGGRLAFPILPSRHDGWSELEINLALGVARGTAVSGNTPIRPTTEDLTAHWREGEPPSGLIALVPVPRYEFWSFDLGANRYEVVLSCKDANGAAAACASPTTPPEVPLSPPQLVGPQNLGYTGRPIDIGGYFLESSGRRLAIAWEEPMHWVSNNPINPFNSDKTGWYEAFSFAGRLESDVPLFSNLQVLAPHARVVMSPDGRTIEWEQAAPYQDGTALHPMDGGFLIDIAGHFDEPPPVVRARLLMGGRPVDSDHIMASAWNECFDPPFDPSRYDPLYEVRRRATYGARVIHDDGDAISLYPRP